MSDPVKITVTDPATGEVLAEQVIDNDYAIVATGSCHVAHINAYANGTRVLTIKGRR